MNQIKINFSIMMYLHSHNILFIFNHNSTHITDGLLFAKRIQLLDAAAAVVVVFHFAPHFHFLKSTTADIFHFRNNFFYVNVIVLQCFFSSFRRFHFSLSCFSLRVIFFYKISTSLFNFKLSFCVLCFCWFTLAN